MALSKVDFNSINVTPAASKAIKFNSSNNGLETGDLGGQLVLLETQTLSSAASTITFDSNIDSTYKEYIFKYTDIHLANAAHFRVNFRDGSTAYDATKTTTYFLTHHSENGADNSLTYVAGKDLAQSTDPAILSQDFYSGGNDSAIAGSLHLFDPSSTTFVKHFIANTQGQFVDSSNPYSVNAFLAGYCNTTTAIDGVQFGTSSGNIDSGTIKMYGVS